MYDKEDDEDGEPYEEDSEDDDEDDEDGEEDGEDGEDDDYIVDDGEEDIDGWVRCQLAQSPYSLAGGNIYLLIINIVIIVPSQFCSKIFVDRHFFYLEYILPSVIHCTMG